MSGPFVVTVTRKDGSAHREAVATLAEAKRYGGEHRHLIGPDGGKIGPLDDGASIEVQPVSWRKLAFEIGEGPGSMVTSVAANGKAGGWPDRHIRAARTALLNTFNSEEGI